MSEKLRADKEFRIYGDNIVECERLFGLIKQALAGNLKKIDGPLESAIAPVFRFQLNDGRIFIFKFFPGFGHWPVDILRIIHDRGGILREAPDAVLTQVSSLGEIPILAAEFCNALPAGNQAWQRNGRAYSLAKAKIPFFYFAELGGYELTSDRDRKASREPNPAVPFSYLTLSLNSPTIALPIFLANPGASSENIEKYSQMIGIEGILSLLISVLEARDYHASVELLEKKALSFITMRAGKMRSGETLSSLQWEEAYAFIKKGRSLVDYVLSKAALPWSKTAYIEGLTASSKRLMKRAKSLAIGLTSPKLPICIVPASKRPTFAKAVSRIYRSLPENFLQWLAKPRHLVICWVMGFKPRGDDARPDRGLPPFARMLIGESADLLTVVYGPATQKMCAQLNSDPLELCRQNGLWEAILAVSNGLLVDSRHGGVQAHLREVWEASSQKTKDLKDGGSGNTMKLGENDIDTALHIIFGHLAQPHVFEGMCNPPGGDWSGISLLSPDQSHEFRWLTLPRVTKKGAKRPDHVSQLFLPDERPIILAIESKERSAQVEPNIGGRLINYAKTLIKTKPSIERKKNLPTWEQSGKTFPMDAFIYASAVAFPTSDCSELKRVGNLANVSLVLGFQFSKNGESCTLLAHARDEQGDRIIELIGNQELTLLGLQLQKI